MKRTAFPIRLAKAVGIVALLSLAVGSLGVLPPLLAAPEPTPRPTATPEPYLMIDPTEAVADEDVHIEVSGYQWSGTPVQLAWDTFDPGHYLGSPVAIKPNGRFDTEVTVPALWATPGEHWVIASNDSVFFARARIQLGEPTPTDTPVPTAVTPPTDTPPPSVTPSPTLSPTPSPTLRPVTPIVTGAIIPPPIQPPPGVTQWPPPTNTRPPVRPTSTPRPRPTSTPTFTPSPTPTDTPTYTPTPTPTDTPTYTPTPTPTDTPTYTPTPTPTDTPTSTPTPLIGEATKVAVIATIIPSEPPPSAGLPGTGASWESIFFQGFIAAVLLIVLLTAFIIVVLVVLLVVWRIMRMRRLQEQA